MPCDVTEQYEGQSAKTREEDVNDALERLDESLRSGEVTVKVGPAGSIAFSNWSADAHSGMSDICAYRRLLTSGSTSLRAALARGEALAGRGVDEAAIAAGMHSHDGGKTWGKD